MQRQGDDKKFWMESAIVVALLTAMVNYAISQNLRIDHQADQITHCGELRAQDLKDQAARLDDTFKKHDQELEEALLQAKQVERHRLDSVCRITDSLTKHLNHLTKRNGYEIN